MDKLLIFNFLRFLLFLCMLFFAFFQANALVISGQSSGHFQQTKHQDEEKIKQVETVKKNSNRCCNENAGNNLIFALFVLSITSFLVTLFIIVFRFHNECTCRKLAMEFKDNLTNAGFGTMTEEQKREYIYDKNRKRLRRKGIEPLLEDQNSFNYKNIFASIMVRLWPFGKSHNSLQCPPCSSNENISLKGLESD